MQYVLLTYLDPVGCMRHAFKVVLLLLQGGLEERKSHNSSMGLGYCWLVLETVDFTASASRPL